MASINPIHIFFGNRSDGTGWQAQATGDTFFGDAISRRIDILASERKPFPSGRNSRKIKHLSFTPIYL
jgi:hypothetical protein